MTTRDLAETTACLAAKVLQIAFWGWIFGALCWALVEEVARWIR